MENTKSLWDNIETTIKPNIIIPVDCMMLTERQWAKKGFLKINENCGKMLWPNRYANGNKCLYLWNSEVRKASAEELKKYFEPERKRQNKYVEKTRDKKKKEQQLREEQFVCMENQIEELEKQLFEAAKMLCLETTDLTEDSINTLEMSEKIKNCLIDISLGKNDFTYLVNEITNTVITK